MSATSPALIITLVDDRPVILDATVAYRPAPVHGRRYRALPRTLRPPAASATD